MLPRPVVRAALDDPVTSRLVVTDTGCYPHATGHRRTRPQGCAQAVVLVCVAGAGWCETPAGRYRVAPGQAVVLPAGVPHAYGADDADPWTIWWMHVTGADTAMLVHACPAAAGAPVVAVPDPARAAALVDEVLGALEHDDSPATLRTAAGAAWHLLALLATARHGAPARDDPAARAVAHLRAHLADDTSVADLAAGVGLSTSHFAALVRRTTGCGPQEYRTRLRMARARVLLDTTDLPVAAVARRVGYHDPLYFSRRFRAVHGTSAREYRGGAKG